MMRHQATKRPTPPQARVIHERLTEIPRSNICVGVCGTALGVSQVDGAAAIAAAAQWVVELHGSANRAGTRDAHGNADDLTRVWHKLSGTATPRGCELANGTEQTTGRSRERIRERRCN